jgi:hypothetical protein
MSGSDGPDPVGSVAEEAAKLLGALSGWAREQGDGVSAMAGGFAGSMTEELHEHLANDSPECAWCPVCRTVAAVRQTSPEVKAHLASAAYSFMLAVSGMMATRTPTRDGRVERIDLDGDPTDDGAEDSFDDWSEDPS